MVGMPAPEARSGLTTLLATVRRVEKLKNGHHMR